MTNSMHHNGRYQSPRAPLSRNEELDALAPPPAQGLFDLLVEYRTLLIAIGAVVGLALAGTGGYALYRSVSAGGSGSTADARPQSVRDKPAPEETSERASKTVAKQIAPKAEPSRQPPEELAAPSSSPQAQEQALAPRPAAPFEASPPADASRPIVEPVVRPAPAREVDSASQSAGGEQTAGTEAAGQSPSPAASSAPAESLTADTAAADAPAAVQNAESFAIDLGSGSSFTELSRRFDEIAQLNQEVPFDRLEPRATVEQDGNGLVAHLRVGPFNTPELAQQACQQLALPAGVECVVSMFEGGRINRR